ncbi:MAG TPA: FtsQ-type POTRA domain-containing protein [Acidimicrobiales bacterium]
MSNAGNATEAPGGGAVVVDPRMRSRRIEVQRDLGRRRLRRVLAVLGTVGVLLAAYAVTRSPLLDVDHVEARGGEHTDEAAVALASGIDRGEAMVGLDTGAIARRVEELPWVESARVERRWPGTVRITVTERTPAAVVPIGAGEAAGEGEQDAEVRLALVDATGRVLTDDAPADAATAGLPALTGVRGPLTPGETLGRDAREALTVVAALTEALPGTVTEISTDLEATLATGGRVRFGTAEDLGDKIVAVETMLADVDLAGLDVLDVRVPGNPVLTRNGGGT